MEVGDDCGRVVCGRVGVEDGAGEEENRDCESNQTSVW